MARIYYRAGNQTGRPNHYYHYLLGYLLPVFEDIDLDADHTICLHSFPPLNYLALGLGFEIVQSHHRTSQTKQIEGHDAIRFWREKPTERYARINDKLDKHLGITAEDYTQSEPYILLVDRGRPEDKLHDKRAPTRRCILNKNKVEECVGGYGNVKRCLLDRVSLREQIIFFRGASYVVAQHGGALSNLVFTEGCKGVLEIVDGKHPHHRHFFPPLSACFGISHQQFFVGSASFVQTHRWQVNIAQLGQELERLVK